ncbi:hypothetical protein IQ235_16460, partial [Oscillatoriales cyanobacterium LEGE 11467]|nr:hypothetical protein [Zarconia navalis LEGE 11467]
MSVSVFQPKERVAIVVQYRGTHFHGWQRQVDRPTIQEELEKALEREVGHPVTVHGAG